MAVATQPIDIIQGALEFEIPCQYPWALNEVVIDGFFYSLVAPYPLSQAPSLYFDMSPSLNGDSDVDIPVALDNLRYNLSRRSEAHNKSRNFDGAYSKPSSYPEKADSNFEGVPFEIHASSADPAPSTTSSIPGLPLYPPGAFYAPSDRDIELPASDDPPSPVAETSRCDTSIHPPGAFDPATINQPPATATEPPPEADHTGLSLYPPGAFHSSDNIDLPASIIEVYSEADETGPSLHPPGAFNSSDVIGRSPINIELQEDEAESCDESVEVGDSSYDGDGSLSDLDGHLSMDDREEPFACEIQGIPGRPGILEQGQATSRTLYLEPQGDYLTDSDGHDPRPTMSEGARVEEMYAYLRSLLAIEPNSDGLDCDDNSDGRALPDILVYVEPRRPTLGPSIAPPSLPGSKKDSDSIPVAGQSGLALAAKVDSALITPGDIVGEAPYKDRSMDTMQSTTTATYDQDAPRPYQDVISPPENPLVNQNSLETSESSLKTTRTPQDVQGYRAGGYLRLHDLNASVQDSSAPSYKTSTKDDHAATPSSPKLAPSASISFADPSPWGTAPATRGVRRLSMTSPRVLLRKGASFYELHRGPDKGLRSIANRQTNVNSHHPMVGHHGLHRTLSTPSFNGRPE
ncbi:hypothetical protein EYR40_008997 [Pleurotus pulmonarius]|nr:hypothetical protein EYR40_008997 [Pleurotus pulmonarius]